MPGRRGPRRDPGDAPRVRHVVEIGWFGGAAGRRGGQRDRVRRHHHGPVVVSDALADPSGPLTLNPALPPRRRRRPGGRAPMFPKQKMDWRETGIAALFLAPSLIVFVTFFYVPFAK